MLEEVIVEATGKGSEGEEIPEEVIEFIIDELDECADLNEWNWNDPDEIESKSRDGFWAWTDGGAEVRAWQTVDYMVGSGTAPKAIDRAVDDFWAEGATSAAEDLVQNHPELKDVSYDIDYNSLYVNELGDYAEELSELEREYTQDIVYEAKIGVYYYKDENFHNPIGKGKDAVSVFAELALDGAKRNDAKKEINIPVDFSTEKGIAQAKKQIAKAITKVCKIY